MPCAGNVLSLCHIQYMRKTFGLIALSCLWCLPNSNAQEQNAELVIPIGHTDGITSVDLSPDGRYWVTGSLDQTLKIWDWNEMEIRTLSGHLKNVLSVAFSPKNESDPEGGRYILSGSSDRSAILWDRNGLQVAKYFEEKQDVVAVAFAPGAPEVLVGLRKGLILILNMQLKEIRRYQYPGEELYTAMYSPDGQFIAATGKGKQAVLWKRIGSTSPVHTFGLVKPITCLNFSQSSQTLVTGTEDGTVTLWKASGEKVRSYQTGQLVLSVAVSPDNETVLAGTMDGNLWIWTSQSQEPIQIRSFKRELSTLRFTPDGRFIVCASTTDNRVHIRQLNGKIFKQLRGYTSAVKALALSPDGSSILVAHADSTAKIWDMKRLTVKNLDYPGQLETVAFSPPTATDSLGGKFILTGCEDRMCRLQNVQDQTAIQIPRGNQAVFSEDGQYILTGNSDGAAQCWQVDTRTLEPLEHTERNITAIAFSEARGTKAFAIGSRDGRVVFWDSLGAVPATITLTNGVFSVSSMAFSSDGHYLACGLKGGSTKVVDLTTKTVVKSSQSQGLSNIDAIAFFPDKPNSQSRTQVILRAAGNDVEIWNTKTGVVNKFKGHISAVTSVAFSSDGAMIFSGSQDGTIKLWDTNSQKELATLASIGATDWAVTAPSGLYDASNNAMKLMHYAVGMDVVVLRQLKERYWEPGLLAKIMGFSKDTVRAIVKFDSVALFPTAQVKIVNDKLEITLSERSGGNGKLSLIINGKRVASDINPPDPATGKRLLKIPPVDLTQYARLMRSDTTNTVGVITYNRDNTLRSQTFEAPYQVIKSRGEANNTNTPSTPQGSDCRSSKQHIYLIVVGTSRYQDTTQNLVYPDQDAVAIADALSATGIAMLGEANVHTLLYTTSKTDKFYASKANIAEGFKEVAQLATPCDLVIVYFSGHGSTWGIEGKRSSFYYLTTGISSAKLRDEGIRKAHAISDEELERWLTAIPAQKQVMILDACNSGKAVENLKGIGKRDLNSTQAIAMGLLNDRTGAFILTGSMADQLSWEASKYGQGLLTYSLLRGISGPGLQDGKLVDVIRLFNFAIEEVPRLAQSIGQTQTPVPKYEGSSFPIGILGPNVKINIPEAKPVFIQSQFQMRGFFLDTLQLAQALNDKMYEERLKGKNARLVYYHTAEVLPDSYRVVGDYALDGNTVTVTGRLFKGSKPIGAPFEFSGKKDMKFLVNNLLKLVFERIPSP